MSCENQANNRGLCSSQELISLSPKYIKHQHEIRKHLTRTFCWHHLEAGMVWIQIAITLLCCFLTQTNADDPCILDLAFVLDASSSMADKWEQVKEFVAEVVKQVNVSSDGSHIAIVQFGLYSNVVMTFRERQNKDDVVRRVLNLTEPKWYASTQLNLGLKDVEEKVFNETTNSYRTEDDVRKVVLIVTDGIQTPPGDPQIPANQLKKRGFEIYAVGIELPRTSLPARKLSLLQNKGLFFFDKASEKLAIAFKVAQTICPASPLIQLTKDAALFAGIDHDFYCNTSSLPWTTVKWLRNDKELIDGEMNQTIRLENKTEGHHYNLTLRIFDLDLGHTGNYTCEATNKQGTKKDTISVTVSCPPKQPILTALNPDMGSNSNVTLKCEAYRLDSKQIHSYSWKWKFNDGREIKKDAYGKYEIFFGYSTPNSCHQSKGWVTLQIRNVSSQDLGQYKCELLMPGMILGVKDVSFSYFASSKVPSPPEIVKLATVDCGGYIQLEWKPSTEPIITGYQIKLISLKEGIHQLFNLSSNVHSKLLDAKSNVDYEVQIRAQNSAGLSLWAKQDLTTTADRPRKPEITNINEHVCGVTIEWSKPSPNGCPILFYTIRYKELKSRQGANDWEEINVTGPSTNQRELKLKCSTTYVFQVVASNEKGKSLSSTVWPATTGEESTQQVQYEVILKIVFTIAGLALAAILLFIGVRYCKKRNKRPEKWKAKDIKVLDHCEIPPIRTEFIELLGQGAFGKVHKAKLKDGLEYFAAEQDWVNTTKRRQKIVAVKELHENANEEEKREFMDEINLMKEVGKHQNVLSFLGCWTTTKPLYLIIEYIAHGDLLYWLRRKRRQITGCSTLGVAVAVPKDKELYAGTRTQITAADQDGKEGGVEADMMEERPGPSTVLDVTDQGQADGDGSNECGIPMIVFMAPNQEESISPARETTDDECDDDCESFDPSDVMSFSRQIARGMSYLSEKGLVHRDLAARNILVGHGKKLKIADFGLMREVYHKIYAVKSQKKLPIKWMAPESIYEQIFTLKSDIWSCGVVMWEIATLGGAPYPLLSNAEIMGLLQTEYRMAKPDLCSDNFYALMTECWKQNPHERPSFQELVERLEELMLQEVEYFDFNLVDETKDYYQVQESKTGEVSCETKFGW